MIKNFSGLYLIGNFQPNYAYKRYVYKKKSKLSFYKNDILYKTLFLAITTKGQKIPDI